MEEPEDEPTGAGDRGSLAAAFGTFVSSDEISPTILARNDKLSNSNVLRDSWYLGMHTERLDALQAKGLENLDVYGHLKDKHWRVSRAVLVHKIKEAHKLIVDLMGDLPNDDVRVPCLQVINHPKWTLGHVAAFYDTNVLNLVKPPPRTPRLAGSALVFDSFRFPHDRRWHLPRHMTSERVKEYLSQCHIEVLERLESPGVSSSSGDSYDTVDPVETFLHMYALVHMWWHIEDTFAMRQLLQIPFIDPFGGEGGVTTNMISENGPLHGDVLVDCGGTWELGCHKSDPWILDAEKFAHRVKVRPFAISRAPVTNAEYLNFMYANGYHNPIFWSFEGWQWREQTKIDHPKFWKHGRMKHESKLLSEHWFVYRNGVEQHIAPHRPICHVNYYEAEAYCRWARRRLPTEAEWEAAACGARSGRVDAAGARLLPWGDGEPIGDHWKFANLEGRVGRLVDVNSFPQGDSACGCRQMLGNVWEWTSTTLYPFPGFQPDFPYRENAAPFFGRPKVNRGGSWASSGLLARSKHRNWDWPELQSNFTGFRTCALEEDVSSLQVSKL